MHYLFIYLLHNVANIGFLATIALVALLYRTALLVLTHTETS